jgi:hypothetical protein
VLAWVTVATFQQLWVILFEPSTKDRDFVLRAFFWQESLLPQGSEPLSSLAVFQFGVHTLIIAAAKRLSKFAVSPPARFIKM